eukprot:COSAG02_NODE_40_length_47766_cov_88.053119_1_plen_72_part_00
MRGDLSGFERDWLVVLSQMAAALAASMMDAGGGAPPPGAGGGGGGGAVEALVRLRVVAMPCARVSQVLASS